MMEFKGPRKQRGFVDPRTNVSGGGGGILGTLGGFFGGPVGGFIGNALGGLFGGLGGASAMRAINQGRSDIMGLPGMGGSIPVSGNFGAVNQHGNFIMDPTLAAGQNALAGTVPGMLAGGMANDPRLLAAMQQNDIVGALGQANTAFGAQQGSSAFGGLGGLYGSLQGQVAGGPQDVSGGLMGNLFAQGYGNQLAAGNQSALYNQSLATQRAAAQPEQNRQFNKLQDRLFAMGMLGSSGGGEQMRGLMEAQAAQDLGFQNNAFGQAMQQQNFLANLGSSQIGLGQGFLGQGLSQYNQNVGNLLGIEGQGFGQQLAANQFNTSQGMNRLSAAQGLFGLGADTFAQNYGLGLQGAQGLLGYGDFGLSAARSPFELQAGLLGASGYHAQALGDMARAQAEASGGLFGGIGNALGGLFG